MPCGGVRVCSIPVDHPSTRCLFCNRAGCGHFYEEWDGYCHAACFLRDLHENPEGEAQVALTHGHRIILDTTFDELPR